MMQKQSTIVNSSILRGQHVNEPKRFQYISLVAAALSTTALGTLASRTVASFSRRTSALGTFASRTVTSFSRRTSALGTFASRTVTSFSRRTLGRFRSLRPRTTFSCVGASTLGRFRTFRVGTTFSRVGTTFSRVGTLPFPESELYLFLSRSLPFPESESLLLLLDLLLLSRILALALGWRIHTLASR